MFLKNFLRVIKAYLRNSVSHATKYSRFQSFPSLVCSTVLSTESFCITQLSHSYSFLKLLTSLWLFKLFCKVSIHKTMAQNIFFPDVIKYEVMEKHIYIKQQKPQIFSGTIQCKSSCATKPLAFKEQPVHFQYLGHGSRVKNSGFVTDLWLTKFDGFIWYFRVF